MTASATTSPRSPAARALEAFIAEPAFPCLGARAALARRSLQVAEAGDLADPQHDRAIVRALQRFAGGLSDDTLFVSLVVIFTPAPDMTEATFEARLWQRLQALHEIDRQQFDWDPAVHSDPASPMFSMSIGGRGFYVIGLHPAASRPARRFRQPALVFNPHSQFERLRADGRYGKLREAISERDVALAGSRNPMLAEHGKGPEARQYSGRVVDADWVCPFQAHGRRP